MVLPEGFVLPAWPFLLALLVALGGVVTLLWMEEPPITDRTVLAFAPWMMLGSALHVLYRIDAVSDPVGILFSAPAVYLTTAVVAGLAWLLGIVLVRRGYLQTVNTTLGGIGIAFFLVAVANAFVAGREIGSIDIFWPGVAVGISVLGTALVWFAMERQLSEVVAATGATGGLVVFGHVLDGVSTAIGYDLLGASEEVPVSQLILEAGEMLPTYEYLGAGWLFVVVKGALAVFVVWMFAEYVREAPRQARVLLAFVAAVGLGPGVHNVLLFTIV